MDLNQTKYWIRDFNKND